MKLLPPPDGLLDGPLNIRRHLSSYVEILQEAALPLLFLTSSLYTLAECHVKLQFRQRGRSLWAHHP